MTSVISPTAGDAVPEPHEIQRQALATLNASRAAGNGAGLVVLATGLGKTWLAAFDSNSPEFRRVLFVAHRDEILGQATDTFRRIRPQASTGFYTGAEKLPDADVLFASIQTLGRQQHLSQFDPKSFDYIVVDEFHHAAARTYRRLIEHFTPKFLLGLTATPERTDGGNLLSLCGDNLVFRRDLVDGIRAGLLSPFQYFGVPDDVDYSNIPWRNTRFDETALTEAVSTQKRAANALEQYRKRGGKRTLAFCCSQRHADFMSEFFCQNGLRSVAVHSGQTSALRADSLVKLECGELDIVCSVDMFNEGVDLPQVDTVMMLRPTESSIVWLQQFGRGLRRAEGKSHLTVIDYIGNHRTFLIKVRTLLQAVAGVGSAKTELSAAMERAKDGDLELPPNCGVTYELEAINVIQGLLGISRRPDAFREFYEEFRAEHGERPTAAEMFHEGYNPRSVRKTHGSWFDFVRVMGDLTPDELTVLQQHGPVLQSLEVLKLPTSFKLLVLLALSSSELTVSAVSVETICHEARRLAGRSAILRRDFGDEWNDEARLNSWVLEQLRQTFGGESSSAERTLFEFDADQVRLSVAESLHATFREMLREVVDWRLAEFLRRPDFAELKDGSFICRMLASGARPILKLPDRAKHLMVPRGPTNVIINGETHVANFVKLFVNVVHRPESNQNVLTEILRGWFGSRAGLPGTKQEVVFKPTADGWTMRPVTVTQPNHNEEISGE